MLIHFSPPLVAVNPMNSFENTHYYSTGLTSAHPTPLTPHALIDSTISKELEKLALIVAQTWLDDQPNVQLDAQSDFDRCLLYVTQEIAEAGSAVGGVIGLAISVGGGSAAARVACCRIFSL